jgi:hypothetical protein
VRQTCRLRASERVECVSLGVSLGVSDACSSRACAYAHECVANAWGTGACGVLREQAGRWCVRRVCRMGRVFRRRKRHLYPVTGRGCRAREDAQVGAS